MCPELRPARTSRHRRGSFRATLSRPELNETARTILAISKGASIGWAVVLVLVAAAAYEAAVALEWISMGSLSGQDASGQAEVTIAAFVALLTGIVATLVSRRILRPWPAALVPVAAAVYMVAHYYAFDPYYLPTLRRFCDGGVVPASWLYGVALAALVVGVAISRRPSTAPVLTPLMLLVCAITVLALGTGH